MSLFSAPQNNSAISKVSHQNSISDDKDWDRSAFHLVELAFVGELRAEDSVVYILVGIFDRLSDVFVELEMGFNVVAEIFCDHSVQVLFDQYAALVGAVSII